MTQYCIRCAVNARRQNAKHVPCYPLNINKLTHKVFCLLFKEFFIFSAFGTNCCHSQKNSTLRALKEWSVFSWVGITFIPVI